MTTGIQPAELSFFATLAGNGSLSAAARELGVTTAAVSKRLGVMEARIGVSLVNRTTRSMHMTPEGTLLLEHARRILGDIERLDQLLTRSKGTATGLLRVNATLGFGRMHVAPVISRYLLRYPEAEVQLQLTANPPPLGGDEFDVCIRFGDPPDARVIARRLAANRRLLCASPKYLSAHGTPATPQDLLHHNCIWIRQGDEPGGVWRLSTKKGGKQRTEAIRTRGNLATNDGEIAVSWALDGHGVLMRAEWDIQRYLKSGRLVHVLPQYSTPDADIYAVCPQRQHSATRVRLFVDFIAESFARPV